MIDLELLGAPAFSLRLDGDDFRFVAVNSPLSRISGLTTAGIGGRTPAECLPADVAEAVLPRYAECLRVAQPIEYEETLDLPGGRRTWRTMLTPVRSDGDGPIEGLIGIAIDITDTKARELARLESQAQAELALEALEGGFWHVDVETKRFQTSRGLGQYLTGNEVALDLGEYCAFILPDDMGEADIGPLLQGDIDRSVGEYRVRTHDGRTRWFRCRRRLIRLPTGEPYKVVGLAFDVTEQREAERRLERDAVTDPLTGAFNRRALASRIEDARRRATGRDRPAVLAVDLDRFKSVNDRLGHAEGDRILCEAVSIMRAVCGADQPVIRLGGDEFVVVLTSDEIELAQLARRLETEMSARLAAASAGLCGASVGAALARSAAEPDEDLMARADADLYAAKARHAAGRKRAA